jgi:hypothetical protein
MQNANDEVKQEGQPADQSSLKQPSESRFNDAEYKRWWDRLRAIRFPEIEQG